MFDFGVGYSELFVLAVIAVIVIGPKDLPKVLRTFGRFMNKARGMAREFQGHVDAAMKDSGMGDLKKDIQALKGGIDLSEPGKPAQAAVPYATTVARKDFETFFGPTASPGETRVAGTTVAESPGTP